MDTSNIAKETWSARFRERYFSNAFQAGKVKCRKLETEYCCVVIDSNGIAVFRPSPYDAIPIIFTNFPHEKICLYTSIYCTDLNLFDSNKETEAGLTARNAIRDGVNVRTFKFQMPAGNIIDVDK